MPTIDLRSDTVTSPTPRMREAMYKAEVGDDGFGDDPTVNRLQEIAAERLGKEAALFVPSGVMGNLVSILTHCQRAQEVILGAQSHIYRHERGGISTVAGCLPRALPNLPDGRLDLELLRSSINRSGTMYAPTRLICLENTWAGRVLDQDYVAAVHKLAKEHSLKTHLDGARIFNASVAQNVEVGQLCSQFDSVQFCFSKGLSAPVGSIICASGEFIKEARNNRHLLGGSMRQVGMIAAACIVAMDEMIERLADDHARARKLAEGLAQMPELELDPLTVETNIVFFNVRSVKLNAQQLAERLREEGLLVVAFSETSLRAVTHYGIEDEHIDKALLAFQRALASTKTAV